MSLPFWAQLEKAQDDATTIEERVAEMIAEHEADPEAHLGEGESLESHKSEDVIDHPAFSVLDDKRAYDRNSFSVPLSDVSIFDHGGAVEIQGIDTAYFASANSSSPQWLYGSLGDMIPADFFFYPVNPRFLIDVMLTQTTSQEGYLLAGYRDESEGFGFKILNDKIYGFYFDSGGSAQTLELLTITAGAVYKLEARVSGSNQIDFYVNNVLIDSFSSISLPTTNGYIWNIPWIDFKSTTSTTRELFVRSIYWEADL
jgi:hypothetical protein